MKNLEEEVQIRYGQLQTLSEEIKGLYTSSIYVSENVSRKIQYHSAYLEYGDEMKGKNDNRAEERPVGQAQS